ncbi:DNA polymerase [Neodiprion lecontei nucleopolyhedrovirus]|uniref:DNA polymerase n=1 Tax=Neodiprion lecontei nucleopolyhedrovirus (strain Canada) TaxID=654906 RepID=Q6JPF1_NPVNC|nr:DNA polymerase [Neodiprion lecontei nucleopolyhedrovirus]AAS16879.1 DNA polymerase [Neodiprion lecontei nucleopolyhedrovirus]
MLTYVSNEVFQELLYDKNFVESIQPIVDGETAHNGRGSFSIPRTVVWRITRITPIEDAERVNKIIFNLTTNLSKHFPRNICVYVIQPKLHMWQRCYCNNFANGRCNRNCIKMKCLLAPGVDGYENTINVFKVYKKYGQTRTLDDFLTTTMRLSHQYNITEGSYIRFEKDITVDKLPIACDLSQFVIVSDNVQEIKISVLAFDIEVRSSSNRFCDATRKEDEIISISLVLKNVDDNILRFCLVYCPNVKNNIERKNISVGKTLVILHNTEKDLIANFFTCVELLNPDFITGYNSSNFDFPYIQKRMQLLKMGNLFFRRFGFQLEVKFGTFFQKFHKVPSVNIPLHAYHDTFVAVGSLKLDNYRLNTVAESLLNEQKIDLPFKEMNRLWGIGEVGDIVRYNIYDSELTLKIFMKIDVINVSYSMCDIMKISTDSLNEGIMKKLTGLIFDYAIKNTNCVNGKKVPDPYFLSINDFYIIKNRSNDKSQENKMCFDRLKRTKMPFSAIKKYNPVKLCNSDGKFVYLGGDVMTPVPGVYENVGIFDFEGMYGTRMIKDKICLSNVVITDTDEVYRLTNKTGVIDKIVNDLKIRRSELKRAKSKLKNDMKTSDVSFEYKMLDISQNTVKEIINSVYGWYATNCKILAAEITRLAREKLYDAQNQINNYEPNYFKVIYGDTDSCFIHVINCDNPVDQLKILENKLNASWNGDGVIEFENYCVIIILYRKKNYCFLTLERVFKDTIVTKRRNKPKLARQSSDILLRTYLNTRDIIKGCQACITYLQNAMSEFNPSLFTSSVQYTEGKNSIASYCVELLKKHSVQTLPHDGERVDILQIVNKANTVKEKSLPLEMYDPNVHTIDLIKFCDDNFKTIMTMLINLLPEKRNLLIDEYQKIFKLITKSDMRCCLVFKKGEWDIVYSKSQDIRSFFK